MINLPNVTLIAVSSIEIERTIRAFQYSCRSINFGEVKFVTHEDVNPEGITVHKVPRINSSDELIVSEMEHHSNIVPWQILCKKTDAKLKVIPINKEGSLDIDTFKTMLNKNVKFVFINHVSNSLGTINPIEEIIELAHKNNSKVLLDGAQGAAHFKINLSEINVDYFDF